MATKSQGLRKTRVRKAIAARGGLRPRLSVFRSSKNIYAQIIDDSVGRTLAAASSLDASLRGALKTGADKDAASAVGKLVAERAVAAGVKQVVFDRGAYLYHGRVKALAEAAREGGLDFKGTHRWRVKQEKAAVAVAAGIAIAIAAPSRAMSSSTSSSP